MRIAARHRRKSPRECQVAGCITDKQNVRLRLEKSGSEMTILNPVSKEEAQRYLRRKAFIVHVADVCHVELLEAMQLMLVSFILGSAALFGFLQITMSR